MGIRARTLLIAATGVVFAGILPSIGCTSILGDFELTQLTQQAVDSGPTTSDGSVTVDSGTTPTGDDGGGGQQAPDDAGGGGEGGVVTKPCTTGDDCPILETTPPRCAVAHCFDGKCQYEAIDKDGDNHKMAGCVATDGKTDLPGDDCNDDDPSVVPSAPCRFKEDGSAIQFPGNIPQGQCKEGRWDCSTGKPICRGAVAPAPNEDCNLRNDANCNGVPDDTCPALQCTYGVSAPKACGNINNKPAPCKAGTQTCTTTGQWGPCVGNVDPKPRDCTSAADNDCNAGPDSSEAACSCPGPTAVGGTQPCTVPNAYGKCAIGVRTCQLTADKTAAQFSDCIGPAPGPKNCSSSADNDCSGVPDEIEPGCGSPCRDANGNPTIARQKFSAKIWGCAGKRDWASAAAACGNGATVCSAATWTANIRAGGKIPTRHYWTSENLGWGGTNSPGQCIGWPGLLGTCPAGPMRVCALGSPGQESVDIDGNLCTWSGCSYQATVPGPNDYMGGCSQAIAGGPSGALAGTLCCLP